MNPYQQRILELLRTLDSPLIDNERFVMGRGLIEVGERLDIDYDYVTEKAADARISTSERAKLRLALMLHASRMVAGWDFLAELGHLDRDGKELALRVLDTSIGTGA